jgi:hypothetical protein
MSDPRRLIDGSSSRLVTELLAAGRFEEPAPELVERFLQTAPLGLTAGVVVARLVSTTAELGASQAVAAGSAAGSTAAGSTAAGANVVAGSMAAPASLAGAGGVTAGLASGASGGGALVQAGGVGVGLMKAAAAGGALVKSGTVAAALVKWVGVGVVGLSAAVGTPKLLDWVDHRNTGVATAPSAAARVDATGVSPVARPRASSPSAVPSVESEPARVVEPTGPAQVVEPARVVEPTGPARVVEPARVIEPARIEPRAEPRPQGVERPEFAQLAARPNRLAQPKSRPAPVAAVPAAPSPHPSAVPSPAREKPPLIVTSPSPARPGSHADLAAIAAPSRNLSSELASVDRARAALARGDARQTLHELAGHEGRYPKGQLVLEVSMLRMEAHVQRGDLPAAREIARRMLAERVSPLHARRARQVLEGQPSPR